MYVGKLNVEVFHFGANKHVVVDGCDLSVAVSRELKARELNYELRQKLNDGFMHLTLSYTDLSNLSYLT